MRREVAWLVRSRGAMEGSEARPTVRMRWRERAVNGALVLVLVGSCADAASGLGAGASDGGSRRSLLVDEAPELCRVASQRGGSLVDYRVLHHCRMRGARATSVALMLLVVALVFWILGDTAERYFCPVVKTLADRWNLAPATAGVTLLALGNGAPDVFASLAAATSSTRNPEGVFDPDGAHAAGAGAGAIVSAGMFVSCAVVGAVALVAAPFPVDPAPFLRDVLCYLACTCATALIVADGKVHAHEAAALPACYVLFVAYVAFGEVQSRRRTVRGRKRDAGRPDVEIGRTTTTTTTTTGTGIEPATTSLGPSTTNGDDDRPTSLKTRSDVASAAPLAVRAAGLGLGFRVRDWFATRWRESRATIRADSALVCLATPLELARRATIPEADPKKWNKRYACANAALSPLLLMGGFGGSGMGGFGGGSGLGGVLMASVALASVLWRVTAHDAPPRWWAGSIFIYLTAFACSVAWIATAARELVEVLATLGDVTGVTRTALSVTVLAIGNSLGDLVADVAAARGGSPTMAVAACFSGPLFNMAVGLGGSFAIAAWDAGGGAGGVGENVGEVGEGRSWGGGTSPLTLETHPTIVVGFGFLIVGLVSTAVIVPRRGYVVTRGHGFGLIALYAAYMACVVIVEVRTKSGGTKSESSPVVEASSSLGKTR